ncbi:DUF333 domain-containing protein [Tatumella sp. TA1]|nr:DUF333 domain-containing protein [Tatumella sp. TA1]
MHDNNDEKGGISRPLLLILDGSRVGMCQLVNGKRCSETALMSGSCAR